MYVYGNRTHAGAPVVAPIRSHLPPQIFAPVQSLAGVPNVHAAGTIPAPAAMASSTAHLPWVKAAIAID